MITRRVKTADVCDRVYTLVTNNLSTLEHVKRVVPERPRPSSSPAAWIGFSPGTARRVVGERSGCFERARLTGRGFLPAADNVALLVWVAVGSDTRSAGKITQYNA